jgi:mannosylglycerate hydrolase
VRAIDAARLARRAQEVLDRNNRGSWTCPSAALYPHQWLWDSCFVAIGLAKTDPARAAGELLALFRGQWSNGMLPHMIFAEDVADVGSTRIWESRSNPLAPRDVATSCITQPPVTAIAVWRVAQALRADARAAFLTELFGKLVAYHEWLYRERDPNHRGLVTLIHPWECGLDTTPPWMHALARMPLPWWARAATRLHLAHLLRFLRNDTKFVPSVQRPTDSEGLGMLVLARHIKQHGFELRRLEPDQSVLVEDLAFNSILAAANRALASIAGEVGQRLSPELETNIARTEAAIEHLWDGQSGQYFSHNAATNEPIRLSTIATFLPLFAGVSAPERAERLIARLRGASGFWPRFPVPTVPTDVPEFREEAYWKGPTWINMNWMIIDALVSFDEHGIADELIHRTLDLVDRAGCFEYFSPLTGRGYGASEFSWTAALVLDLLASRAGGGLLP